MDAGRFYRWQLAALHLSSQLALRQRCSQGPHLFCRRQLVWLGDGVAPAANHVEAALVPVAVLQVRKEYRGGRSL